jgi:hypothetical protein
MPALLRRDDGRAVIAAGAVLPDAICAPVLPYSTQSPLRGRKVVIHMAAQALVRATYRDPVETYAVNVKTLARHWDAATWRMADGKRSRLRARVLRRQAVGPAQSRRSSPLAARSRTRPSMQDRCIEGPGAARVASAAGHRPALDWTAV